jgi:hypothetical protein
MRNPILAGIALGAMLLAEGTVNQAAAIFVRTPPPRPVSVGAVGRRPGRGFVWTNGYYRWNRPRRGRPGFVWMPGQWRRPPRHGMVWVSPGWRRGRGGYTFVAGGWR